jgi:hypothetical protein
MAQGRWLSAMLAAVVLAATTACVGVVHAAPPTVICGQVVSESAAGAYVQDVSSGSATVDSVSVGDDIFLKLAPDCGHGATVTVVPARAASVVKQVKADDGKLAAIVLQPTMPEFEIRVGRPGGATDSVDVRLEPRNLGSS